MADEDTILEARKWIPYYARQISWSVGAQKWTVHIPELPGCSAPGGDSAENANKSADEAILLHLLMLKENGSAWPMPKRLNSPKA